MNMSSLKQKWGSPLLVAIVAVLVTLSLTMTYVSGALNGKFNHIYLPAKMFGIPKDVAAHGYDLLFKDDRNTGWDGQFYYYIANDPFARRDTPSHVDADAYRYQRVGLPMLAYIVARATGQKWVSPQTYYGTNLAILFLATLLGAFFLRSKEINPYWILLWTLGMGPQITQLHGLPDGAADGLLIIALVCMLNQRKALYTAAITFAALSREIYVLVPCALMAADFVLSAREQGWRNQLRFAAILDLIRRQWYQAIPLLFFLAWQVFVRVRFHIAPSDQAFNILGFPFKASLQYMLAPLTGMREWNRGSRLELFGILLFLLLLFTSAWKLTGFVRTFLASNRSRDHVSSTQLGIAFAFLPIVAMYFCFGSTVMMDNTGYWKATNIFLFVLPLLAAMQTRRIGTWVSALSLVCFALFNMSFLWRVNSDPIEGESVKFATTEPACLKYYNARITPISMEVLRGNWWRRLTGATNFVINADVTNTGNEDFIPYLGKGNVAASYHWINAADNSVAKDGQRTSLRDRLVPGETTRLPVRIETPTSSGHYVLKLTLVQEGCAWFYAQNPQSSFNIDYTIR